MDELHRDEQDIEPERKRKKSKRRCVQVGNKTGLLLIFVASLIVSVLVIMEAPYNRLYLWQQVLDAPSLFFLNFLPILLFMLLVFALTNRSVCSIVISSAVFLLFGAINRYKIVFRQDPLIPGDFTLVTEFVDTLRNFNTTFLLLVGLGIAALVLLLFFSLYFFRDQEKRFRWRAIAIALCIVLVLLSNTILYADADRYSAYNTNGYPGFKVREYGSKGFVYSFFVDYNKMKVEKPKGYDAAAYKNLDTAATTTGTAAVGTQPHIIMIMGETFADLGISGHISFNEGEDPMEQYRRMVAESYCSGYLTVPLFGGGTASTEFEALTGMQASVFGNSISPYRLVRKNIRSLPRILKANGYESLALHPGRFWFYNRANVYPYMGFDEMIFAEDGFDIEGDKLGGYLSEEATMDMLIQRFGAHLDASELPYFLFCVTIQNHGPYGEKYGDMVDFNSDLDFTAEETAELGDFFRGLDIVDGQLERLADYVDGLDEPVVLVYFGDHLPGFTSGSTLYDKMDIGIYAEESPERMLLGYETPFFIWLNDAAEAQNIFDGNAIPADEDVHVNTYYLCSMLYRLLGYGGQDAFLDRLDEMRLTLPVVKDYIAIDGEGQTVDAAAAAQDEDNLFLQGWTYYRMFDEKVTGQ